MLTVLAGLDQPYTFPWQTERRKQCDVSFCASQDLLHCVIAWYGDQLTRSQERLLPIKLSIHSPRATLVGHKSGGASVCHLAVLGWQTLVAGYRLNRVYDTVANNQPGSLWYRAPSLRRLCPWSPCDIPSRQCRPKSP